WYFQSPITITSTINGILDYLNIISDAGDKFERLVLDIYLWANARAIYAENQVADLQTQLTNSQIHLYSSRKTQALQSQQKQPNFSDNLRVPNKYMLEKPPDG
ncbi:14942_t:CDS:2, partial [Cetraspora pellucida]